MKRLLLLGDSIRLNYAPYVYRKLSDRALITGPEENGRFAKYTLHELPGWLRALGRPDVIHWNNGLWDLHHFNGREPLTALADYCDDLTRIYEILRQTGARVVFATCTPVRADNPEWDNGEIAQYNAAAVALMDRWGVPVNDLHRVIAGHEAEWINEDDKIHLNRLGIKAAGDAVIAAVSPLL